MPRESTNLGERVKKTQHRTSSEGKSVDGTRSSSCFSQHSTNSALQLLVTWFKPPGALVLSQLSCQAPEKHALLYTSTSYNHNLMVKAGNANQHQPANNKNAPAGRPQALRELVWRQLDVLRLLLLPLAPAAIRQRSLL